MTQLHPSQSDRNISETEPIPGGTKAEGGQLAARLGVYWVVIWPCLADRPGSLSEWGLEESWRFPDAPVPDAHAGFRRPFAGCFLLQGKPGLPKDQPLRFALVHLLLFPDDFRLPDRRYCSHDSAGAGYNDQWCNAGLQRRRAGAAGVLRWRGGPQSFAGAGMAFGRFRIWILYGLGLVLFYGLQALLNYVFKFGTLVDIAKLYPPGVTAGIPPIALLGSSFLNVIIIGPFLGLIITFGEEYGWRGFLQSELVHLGRIRGVGLLGIIWGVWHWPIILMGFNYPGQPVLGPLLMTGYTVVLSYFLAYAVFKSKGVWTAAYLHALSNQTLAFFMTGVVMPVSVVMSFGIGVPGLILSALVILLILRDPIWKESD